MNKLKKLGKGLEDISYLFLSQDENQVLDPTKSDAQKETAAYPVKVPTKSVGLIGNSTDFRDAFLVINLSLALARLGMRITVVDMDEDLPCLKFFLGRDVQNTEISNPQMLIKDGPLGVKIIGLNQKSLSFLASEEKEQELMLKLKDIEENSDLILISVMQQNLLKISPVFKDLIREFLVLVNPESNNMINAYKVMKIIFAHNPLAKVGAIIADIDHMYEIDKIYNKLAGAVRKFLDKELYKYGFMFKIKQEIDSNTNIASFYDADLTACISNIAQIIVLRLNLEETNPAAGKMFFKRIVDEFSGLR
ncbi:MAG: hypothetical protein ABIG64_05650 [Candidatus Omnitrophota bacterium]